ncbi:hypothetical protein BGZ65_005966 [Modicella reniformis]|uniref:Uncharacterized protein n=1 Tax=Modicella reniformis TaxID=1440133 RepID=A0A9P6LYE4_9FUNG|nr:hypothetical protein BGZ65_005966 [Modicella reniformis]
MTPTISLMQSMATAVDDGISGENGLSNMFNRHLGSPSLGLNLEREVNPFDTNDGEFKQMEPESPRSDKAVQPKGFVPPPHALPMELVLLRTFNDSDHLPEHYEWTQDEDYWYYVTKAHGVRRRKLKKVSTWWLDIGSFGSALLSGSSTSSEPIATGPVYNMGHATETTTPSPSFPLSSDMALSNGRQTPISAAANQELSNTGVSQPPNVSTIKKQSSPRNSHMGKYYYVDWDEYISL